MLFHFLSQLNARCTCIKSDFQSAGLTPLTSPLSCDHITVLCICRQSSYVFLLFLLCFHHKLFLQTKSCSRDNKVLNQIKDFYSAKAAGEMLQRTITSNRFIYVGAGQAVCVSVVL